MPGFRNSQFAKAGKPGMRALGGHRRFAKWRLIACSSADVRQPAAKDRNRLGLQDACPLASGRADVPTDQGRRPITLTTNGYSAPPPESLTISIEK